LERVERAFLVQHERSDDGHVKIVGIYSSPSKADAAIQRLRDQPGFRDFPDGFTVDAYELDEDHWAEGFVDL
jgi:hypothetical protein